VKAVTPLDPKFDIQSVLPQLDEIARSCPFFSETHQISFRYRSSLGERDDLALYQDGLGSLFDFKANQWLAREADFNSNHPKVTGTPLETIIKEVSRLAQGRVGRFRLMRLKSKTCYSWHQDPDELRYHIPLVTNEFCLYLTEEGGIERLPEPGRLYSVRTNIPHTAVNASFQDRFHLVISTWS